MARPQVIQQLRHDKFLCKAVFPDFVDSWNYVANRIDNIKGDADINSQYGCGHIKVDNSDPEHPIIRCVNLPTGGGGSVEVDNSSIQKVTESYGDYIQLLNFKADQRKTPSELSNSDVDDFLFRQKTSDGETTSVSLQYIGRQYIINPIPDDASIEQNGTYQGQAKWQLYNFDDLSYKMAFDSVGANDSFVVRHNNVVSYIQCNELRVVPDSEVGNTFSIEGCGNSPKELRLWQWSNPLWKYTYDSGSNTFWDLCDNDNCDILVRNRSDLNGYSLSYMNLRNLSRFADSQIPNTTLKSIDVGSQSGKIDFHLHNFTAPSIQTCGIRLRYDGCAYHITNGGTTGEQKQVLVRNGTGATKELEYWDFTIVAPKIGCGDLTDELWEEIESSHCNCASKWEAYYSWKAEIENMLGLGSGSGCFWRIGGTDATNTCESASIYDLTIGCSLVVGCSYMTNFRWSIDTQAIEINGTLTIDDSATFNNGASIATNKTLTIGSTSLNETQLQQLLRLL